MGGEPEAARQRLAAGRPPDPGRALPRPRERGLARAAGAGDGGAEPAQGRRLRQVGRRARCAARSTRATAAPPTTSSARSTGTPRERRADDHLHARHQARAHRSARAADAGARWSSELVAKASNDANRDPQIGRTLFDLLVPVEMEPFLGGTSEMVIELDSGTAALPWELLDTSSAELSGSDPRPWAIRSKLLRKLRTSEFRAQPSDADADGSVLVIGEPMRRPGAVPAAAGRARRGDRGRDAADRRACRRRRRARARADERQRRRAQHHQRAVRAAVPHRPRRRPRRAGAPTAASSSPAAPTSARPR